MQRVSIRGGTGLRSLSSPDWLSGVSEVSKSSQS